MPARLPFTLLNGASGIAVGLATEIPSHNLREVARGLRGADQECRSSPTTSCSRCCRGRTTRAAARSSARPADIAEAYRTGRGSLKVRARWKIEELARGQWQLVVTELPPGVSTQKVLEEIEELTNPKVKAGKKALTPEQNQLKATVLAVLDVVRDESSKDAPVRLVLRAQDQPHRTAGTHHHAAGAHQPGDLGADQHDDGRAGRPADAEVPAPDAGGVDRLPPGHHRAALAPPPGQGRWTASTSSKAGSWCCSTSTK